MQFSAFHKIRNSALHKMRNFSLPPMKTPRWRLLRARLRSVQIPRVRLPNVRLPRAHKILFAAPPETAHDVTIRALSLCARSRTLCRVLQTTTGAGLPAANLALQKTVMGIDFPNPIGLAAGFDKHATAVNALHAFGFGWLELGTVTPQPQAGNAKPRVFRLPERAAIINRMGLNSVGISRFVKNLARAHPQIIKGINIGVNNNTDMVSAVDDYLVGLTAVYPHADYVAINISCPNVPNLIGLQDKSALHKLFRALDQRRAELAYQYQRRVPLVVKISPDLADAEIATVAELARTHHLDGIAATNTTRMHEALGEQASTAPAGGLSGPPLAARALSTVQRLYRNLQGEIPLIGIGGVDSAERAVDLLEAGAELVQIYTGFIYHGARLPRRILADLPATEPPATTATEHAK